MIRSPSCNAKDMDLGHQIISSVIGTFNVEFAKAYRDLVLSKLMKRASNNSFDERLYIAPLPEDCLKVGVLKMRGEKWAQVKSRYFEVLNKSDNYRVDYYDKRQGERKGFF